MIKCGKLKGKDDKVADQCILYTKDGSKALGYFPYSKHGSQKAAKAAAHKREGQVQFFKKKHQGLLDAVDAFGAPVVLKYLLDKAEDCEACQEVVKSYVGAQGDEAVEKAGDFPSGGPGKPPVGYNVPKNWTPESAKKYWTSIGGSVTACMSKLGGEKAARFCASLKDYVTGSKEWRGKKKKSFTEEAEEALTMLEKDEDDTMIDLKELERLLAGDAGNDGDSTEPTDSVEPEPTEEPVAVEGPEPIVNDESVEELPNDFRTFLLREHAERKAGVLAMLGEEAE